jgi:hypothetical protein
MKAKKLITGLWCIAISAACLTGCADASDKPVEPFIPANPPLPPDPPPLECEREFPAPVVYPLAHTQWKLAGTVDVETGEIKTLDHPADCEDCYTLDFDTDSTASAHSIIGDMTLDLSRLHPYKITQELLISEEYSGSHTFFVAIYHAGSYTASADEFKLYYYYKDDPKLNYLLFKRINP